MLAELVSPTAQASSTEGIAKPKSVETPILPLEKPLEANFQVQPLSPSEFHPNVQSVAQLSPCRRNVQPPIHSLVKGGDSIEIAREALPWMREDLPRGSVPLLKQ